MSRNHLILVFNLILKSNYLWEKSLLLKCVVFSIMFESNLRFLVGECLYGNIRNLKLST